MKLRRSQVSLRFCLITNIINNNLILILVILALVLLSPFSPIVIADEKLKF